MRPVDAGLKSIAVAQAARARARRAEDWPELHQLLAEARKPNDVHQALLRDGPVRLARERSRNYGPSPSTLRDEAAAAGVLDATPDDLAFRRLFPTLDDGVYCASHAMGIPSVALQPAITEAVLRLQHFGVSAWSAWMPQVEQWRVAVAELCGLDLMRGDVAAFPNFSEALCVALGGVSGRMVTDATFFTTATYIHRAWAERTGSDLHEVQPDADGVVSGEQLAAAIDGRTTVVSVSHACWRNGYLVDLEPICEAIAERCPDATLLVDVYQTLGTVPLALPNPPLRFAVLGGGIKQLHSGPGAGFGWFSHPLLASIDTDRTGWWAHSDPLAFADDFAPAQGASRLRTGTLHPWPLLALLTEARVLAASSGGELAGGIARARRVTQRATAAALKHADARGLSIAGARHPSRRAAFFGVRVNDGPRVIAALAEGGVVADFRANTEGSARGLVRLSGSAASFPYELEYAIERIASVEK